MMKLHINALRVRLATNRGPFGATAVFSNGLNVIRAENTSGKSALINAILYALGIEILIGKRGVEAVKPVLRNAGEYEGQDFNVIESLVELEITNASGESITVRRYVTGDRDPRLVEVAFGPVLTGLDASRYRIEPFFVGMEGAAQRERGFHHFLASFLGLQLPYVKRFRGEDVPLYLECIAPLMFIEQIRGWSGIQMTMPQGFGIRNVGRLAVEYILGLDVIENEKRSIEISEEANQIREAWHAITEAMSRMASHVGGRVVGVPSAPVASLDEEPMILVPIDNEAGTVSLDDFLVSKRSLLINGSREVSSDATGSQDLQERLEPRENELLIAQAELSQLRSDIYSQEDELRKMQARLEFIRNDIQRNKDIKRLRDFGVEAGLSITQDRCPTCNQSVSDSLVLSESSVMGVEENINFLQTEADAVALLISAGQERLTRLQGSKAFRSQAVGNLRVAIRDLRSDLLQHRDISIASIREQVHLQEEIARLEQLRDEFTDGVRSLRGTVERWQLNRSRRSELPNDYFSVRDRQKLTAPSEQFATSVAAFGYRSSGVSELHISEDNYRPVCDDFEVAFGASASDNIRLIWAYTLALLQVSLIHNGNHWGIVLFDEPEQQRMSDASSAALYAAVAAMPPESCQVIVATSASEELTRQRLLGLPHNLLEYGDKVVRPI